MIRSTMLLWLVLSGSAQSATGQCDWNGGSNRYTLSPEWAISQMTDIPIAHRTWLAAKASFSAPTDTIRIFKDGIESDNGVRYKPGISDMYFGQGPLCKTVGLAHWPAEHFEPAKVWCSGPYCVAIPTVCGNVTRVALLPRKIPEPNDLWLALIALACGGIATWLNWRK